VALHIEGQRENDAIWVRQQKGALEAPHPEWATILQHEERRNVEFGSSTKGSRDQLQNQK